MFARWLSRWRAGGALLTGAIALLAAGCGSTKTVTVTTPGPAANAAGASGTPHVYEGTVSSSGNNPTINLDCGSDYLEAGPDNRGTITDSLKIDTAGSDAAVSHSVPIVEKSVAWGHIGSRLATQAHLFPNIPGEHHGGVKKHYKFTLYCTGDKDAAWVIFG